MAEKTREEALALLSEYTKSESLIKHALAVEAGMHWYAEQASLGEGDTLRWRVAGLLHDFDYEAHPEPAPPDGHPFFGNRVLAELGYDQEIRDAIMGHAHYTGAKRETQMAKTLFAVDELSGLITASVLVRPDKSIANLEPASVLKKMKDKAFARGCNRDDIRQGAEELGIELSQHVQNLITAMRRVSTSLGL